MMFRETLNYTLIFTAIHLSILFKIARTHIWKKALTITSLETDNQSKTMQNQREKMLDFSCQWFCRKLSITLIFNSNFQSRLKWKIWERSIIYTLSIRSLFPSCQNYRDLIQKRRGNLAGFNFLEIASFFCYQ